MMRIATAGNKTAQRFRDAALPWLDDAYTFAHVLLQSQAEAEQAVEQCYQRALRAFDGFRGPSVRPWLLAILREVCHEMLSLRGMPTDAAGKMSAPDRRETPTIQQLVDGLPAPLRETLALREYIGLTYQEIAEVTGVPAPTVMSRIAEGRALLLSARRAANNAAQATAGGPPTGGASGLTIYRASAY